MFIFFDIIFNLIYDLMYFLIFIFEFTAEHEHFRGPFFLYINQSYFWLQAKTIFLCPLSTKYPCLEERIDDALSRMTIWKKKSLLHADRSYGCRQVSQD